MMDASRFDRLVNSFSHAGTRRGALGLMAGLAGLGVSEGAARARRKHRRTHGVRAQGAKADKVRICHFTGSESNPYEILEVSGDASAQHGANHGDFAINADDGCCLDSDCTAFVDSFCDEAADGGAQCACDATVASSIPVEACDTVREPCPSARCGAGSNVAFGHSRRCCNQAEENCFKQALGLNEIVAFCLPQR
jgi:hypothetical protein